MDEKLESIWALLEEKIESGSHSRNRVYRRLDLDKESGLRLGVTYPGNIREFFIQIDEDDKYSFNPPKWVGMRFDMITLDIPHEGTKHILLYLEDREHIRVFTTICSDITETLSQLENPSLRVQRLQDCLEQWTRFFEKFGPDGLSQEAQRGLYGELTWLEFLLKTGIDMAVAVESWKGCNRAYHDFETKERVVEVKTTMTKEPRRVRISNERQLDNRGLKSLHLYVLTLQRLESGGETLPELVEKIREALKDNELAGAHFERSLKKAGYLDIHTGNYTSGYIQKKQEIFLVNGNFPRIIDPPAGVGDISYSVTISACSDFALNLDLAVTSFTEG